MYGGCREQTVICNLRDGNIAPDVCLASLSLLLEKHSGNMKLLLLESLNHSKLIQLNENNNGWITFLPAVYTTSLHLIDWAQEISDRTRKSP